MKQLFLYTCVFSLLAASASAGAISITSNGSSVYFQENPSAPGSAVRTLGETFAVPNPTALNLLTTFSFAFASGTSTSFDYRAYIYQWDTANARATGSALFTSSTLNGSQAPSFSGLNIALTPGLTYVAFITTEGVVNNGYADGLLAHNSGNTYAGGQAFQQTSTTSHAATGTGSWTSSTWTPVNGNTDLQFSAVFGGGAADTATPEPASLVLMVSGAGALLLLGRRRIIRG